jgi:hypothetical protein
VPVEVATYLAALRAELEDLPHEEREDLLAEVEASLIDAAEEGERPIAAHLGPPEAFAAELRASAGLHPQPAAPPPPAPSLLALARGLASRLAADPRLAGARRRGAELAPVWWVARAYVAVAALTLLAGGEWSAAHPALPHLGGPLPAALVLLAAAAASVALGLRARRGGTGLRAAALALNLLLVALCVPVLAHAADASPYGAFPEAMPVPVAAAPLPGGLVNNGNKVRNVYAYARDGRMLHDVLLYDEAGQPLEIGRGETDPQRRVVIGRGGQLLYNAFPIRYFDPGTGQVTNPNAGPPIRIPPIRTPPLTTPRRP